MASICEGLRWSPRGHNLKSLASKSASPRKCPVLGSRAAIFFDFGAKTFFVEITSALCPWLLALLDHSCPWPREGLSSEGQFLALASDFFRVFGLGLELCVLGSTFG